MKARKHQERERERNVTVKQREGGRGVEFRLARAWTKTGRARKCADSSDGSRSKSDTNESIREKRE